MSSTHTNNYANHEEISNKASATKQMGMTPFICDGYSMGKTLFQSQPTFVTHRWHSKDFFGQLTDS